MDEKTKLGLAAAGALGAGLAYRKNRKDKTKEKYGVNDRSKQNKDHSREYVDDLIANSPEIMHGLKK